MPSAKMFDELLNELYPSFKYRLNQKETIIKILQVIANSNKKYIILDSPTGSGKSHIARQVAEVYNHITKLETLFLTKSIQLQHQYTEDFPEIKLLKGATNYDCNVDYPIPIPPNMKHHEGCKYPKLSNLCDYNKARSEYLSSNLKLLNYAFYFTSAGKFNTNGLLIIDEAHNLEVSILNTFELELNISNLIKEEIGDIRLEDYLPDPNNLKILSPHNVSALREFLHEIIERLVQSIIGIESSMDELTDSKSIINILESRLNPLKKKLNKFKGIHFILSVLARDDFNKWIIIKDKDSSDTIFNIKPLFIPKFLTNQILEGSKVLMMSATALRIKDSLKIKDSDCETITVPYIFDLKNRPVYAITSLPSLNMNTFDKSFPLYVKMFDDIMDNYDIGTNVLVHSVSYKNAELLKVQSRHKNRMIIPTKDQIRDIKSIAGNGNILVSPSMIEGVDLAEGLANVQFFFKVPWPYLGDTWISKKLDMDTDWYSYTAMLNIIQGSGRGIRGPEDKADTFILDSGFKRLVNQTEHLTPTWFKNTLNWV